MTYYEEFVTCNQGPLSQSPKSTSQQGEAHSGTGKDEQENEIDLGRTNAEEYIHASHSNGEKGKTGVEARLLQTLSEVTSGRICSGRSVKWVKSACEGEVDCAFSCQLETSLGGWDVP